MTITAPVVYRIWINALPPKLANKASNHWFAYAGQRKRWLKLGMNALRHQLGTPPKAQKVEVKVTAYVAKLSDPDNADGYRKGCLDLIVLAGMVPDDSLEYMVIHPVEQKVIGGTPRRPLASEGWPDYGKRMMAHLQKLGVMIDVTVLA